MSPSLSIKDYEHICLGVRQFLERGNLVSRIATGAKLYLEFPDVGSMHDAHVMIMRDLRSVFVMPKGDPWHYIDDHTILFEPYAGVSIILTCAQRFAVKSGGFRRLS